MKTTKNNRIKVTWSIDVDLVKQIRHTAIDKDSDVSTLIENAIRKYLGL